MSYAYIHVPFCKSICAYCDFVRCGYHSRLANLWLDVVCKEIKEKLEGVSLKTIYIGGGTPTALSLSQLKTLLETIQPYAKDVIEYTIEANVESLSDELLALLQEFHVNRISLGVQTLQQHLIDLTKRHHTKELVLETIERIHKFGIHNISCDLIYGLPTQTLHDFQEDLSVLAAQRITHISLYSLTIEEHSEFGRMGVQAMEEELESDLFEYAIAYLTKQGFEHYEVSNFAKIGYRSNHNQAYWHYEDFIGIGCGASGKENHRRYDNTRNLQEYFECGASPTYIEFDHEEEVFEAIMMGLRMSDGINLDSFHQRFQIHLLEEYHDAIKKNMEHANLVVKDGVLKVTNKGMMILNEVLLDFLS